MCIRDSGTIISASHTYTNPSSIAGRCTKLWRIAAASRLERTKMTNKPISEAQDPDIRNSQAALERAAKQAREIAINSGTSLVVKRNGKTVLVGPSKK